MSERAEVQRLVAGTIETAPEAIVVVDREGVIALANTRAQALFRYAREELVGEQVELLAPEWSRAGHVRQRAAYASDPSVRPMGAERALSARAKDGSEFPAGIKLSPVWMNGNLLVAASVRRIDAAEPNSAAPAVSAERFRSAFGLAPVGMALSERGGRIVSANRAFCAILGYEETELLQRAFAELIHPDDTGAARALAGSVLAGEPAGRAPEQRLITKEGRAVWVRMALSILDEEAGGLLQHVVHVADISREEHDGDAAGDLTAQLRAILDWAPLGLVLCGLDGGCCASTRRPDRGAHTTRAASPTATLAPDRCRRAAPSGSRRRRS